MNRCPCTCHPENAVRMKAEADARAAAEFAVVPIGDFKGRPWSEPPSSYLRWMIGKDDDGEPLCDYVAARPALAARVRQELAERDRPPGSTTFPGFA